MWLAELAEFVAKGYMLEKLNVLNIIGSASGMYISIEIFIFINTLDVSKGPITLDCFLFI